MTAATASVDLYVDRAVEQIAELVDDDFDHAAFARWDLVLGELRAKGDVGAVREHIRKYVSWLGRQKTKRGLGP